MMRQIGWLLVAVAILSTPGCRAMTASECTALGSRSPDSLCVLGTVHYYTFEGGCWAVRGDDGITYDPLGGLPAEFQRDGLRVRLEATLRPDMASFHMAGPIVEIISIRRL